MGNKSYKPVFYQHMSEITNCSHGNKPIPDGVVRWGWGLVSGAGKSKGVGKKRPRFSGALMGCCRRPLASRDDY